MSSEVASNILRYEIVIQGHLAPGRLSWIDDLTAVMHPDGETHLITGELDQSALLGLLNGLSDLGITLLSVRPLLGANP